MNEREAEAVCLLREREWGLAAEAFDKLLGGEGRKEREAGYLLARSECHLELGRHEAVVHDCSAVVSLLGGLTEGGARARRRLVHALFALRRFTEAEAALDEWVSSSSYDREPVKTLERLRRLLDPQPAPDYRGEPWFSDAPPSRRNHPVKLIHPPPSLHPPIVRTQQPPPPQVMGVVVPRVIEAMVDGGEVSCSYCGLSFSSKGELVSHCQTEEHQRVIMSDEGRTWTYRPPPRGLTADSYTLCDNFSEFGSCRFGAQCVEAHGTEELSEWQERFEYRRMKLQRACEKQLYGKSYTEQLMDKLLQSAQATDIMKTMIEGVDDKCDSALETSVTSKNNTNSWTFTLVTAKRLRAVALLQDTYRNHFYLKYVSSKRDNETLFEWKLNKSQEWTGGLEPSEDIVPPTASSELDPDSGLNPSSPLLTHSVTVEFTTDIYGTFRQAVIFDLGSEPVLVKHICVDVTPVTDSEKLKEIKKELVISSSERWDKENSTIMPFGGGGGSSGETDREKELLAGYPTPHLSNFTLSQATLHEKRLTSTNYRERMHQLLAIEEISRYDLVSRYNLEARLLITKNYLLSPGGVGASTAKYAHNGELFALMNLTKDLSEDTSAGRLILSSCSTVLLSKPKAVVFSDSESETKEILEKESLDKDSERVVYEALIEDKGKNAIYLRLSAFTVQALNLKPETKVTIDVQFQLNRIPYCEWHQAIDKIADFRFIFPDTYLEPTIPWSPQRQWNDSIDPKLNLKQKEAVIAITTPTEVQLPPILIIGPFGTGKTYTLAQALKQVLKQAGTRILVCTHSNSAADLYIKDYLHPYVEAGHKEATPLRIFYHKRWVASVSPIVQKYSVIDTNEQGMRAFKIPKLEDILKYRVIVVTLSISMYLSTMGLPKGYFSHILLDEAAQAMECEAIMPLALANDHTRIVLAGDHMQLSPELFSQFAKERNLHMSLLERLYDHYPSTFPCKILLCENYRAHEAIIQFTSELFYEQKLISSGKQPRHEQFYPLTFFTTRGEDVQDLNSTAFYNNAEVYEIVERVSELRKRWPSAWGKMTDHSIGIMTPYADQVFRIRSELRKRRLGGISVERVLNVQGKQFRAVFLSTVRTRRTCDASSSAEMDYGFLSNSKLLNTAITRAQSLVAVIGDPIALCSVGRCRKVWERFISICSENNSLFGITWSSLRSQLDGVELKKTYTLNPLAPEFIPRQYQQQQQQLQQQQQQQQQAPLGIKPLLVPPIRLPPQFIPPLPIYQVPVFYPVGSGGVVGGGGVQAPPPPSQGGVAPPAWPFPPPQILPPPQIKRVVDCVSPSQTQGVQDESGRVVRLVPGAGVPPHPIQFIHPPPHIIPPDIHFLHNVPFPPDRQNAVPVLPANLTLDELMASQQKQFEWYNHLLDTLGPEAAAKFREFIAQVGGSVKKVGGLVDSTGGGGGLGEVVQSFDEIFIERVPEITLCNPGGQPPPSIHPPIPGQAQQPPPLHQTPIISQILSVELMNQVRSRASMVLNGGGGGVVGNVGSNNPQELSRTNFTTNNGGEGASRSFSNNSNVGVESAQRQTYLLTNGVERRGGGGGGNGNGSGGSGGYMGEGRTGTGGFHQGSPSTTGLTNGEVRPTFHHVPNGTEIPLRRRDPDEETQAHPTRHLRSCGVPLYQRGVLTNMSRSESPQVTSRSGAGDITGETSSSQMMTYASVLRSRKEEMLAKEQISRDPLTIIQELNNTPTGLYHYFP